MHNWVEIIWPIVCFVGLGSLGPCAMHMLHIIVWLYIGWFLLLLFCLCWDADHFWLIPGTLSCSVLLRTCIALLISNWHWGIEPSSSCSLETRPVISPGKQSEVLLKRQCLCVFIFVPSRKSPHLRQLVEGRDKQSIPHYSVSLLLAPITWL